ncbi:BROMODOMAIN CONTAINING PROTEIN [Salix purpurea]|uniref:BROMODOMAIN CONTAINING PROTEIN n=1 Tax=Salix purpurea TaxID=77065 RepID=A0A9Q0PAU8_SALPP|nr:BROMODOMAIN CONTAINING PROTEIN [Salix purpurea]
MGEVADPTMKKKKKKGRPSLLELQKRSLKQQQLQQTTPISLKNPNSPNSNPALPNRRSSRRSSNSYAPEWIDGDDDEDDDEDDERKEKKHKLLRGLNSQKNNNQNSNSLSPSSFKGSDSNAGGGNQEDGIRRRKISAVRLGSDDLGEKVLKGTDTIHGSSVEPGPTTPLPDKKLLVFILDRLQKKDTYGVFSEPVDPEELPDYFDIVENPMDFSTVKKKLDEGAYAYLEQFEKDVLLICSNAMLYNPPDTIYFRQARAMQELAKKDFENLRQDSDDSEPQPKVVRRGRPPALGKLKKALERSPIDRVGPEVSSDATLATGGDHSNLSNGYNLRKSSSYKYQPGDAFVRASYSNENYSTWLSEWENEFPASVVKAVMKYGKKPFVLDENKRDTYKHPLGSHEPSILSTFEGEIKQLVVVGLSSEHGYARSLARFAADLGPVVWRIASKKIESVLPTGVEFGPGWVGENKAMEKQKILNNLVSDNHLSRFQPATSSSREAAWNREDVLETVGGLNPQNELATMNRGAGGMKSVPSFQIQQKRIIHPDMNGFSGGFGYNSSPQPGMARTVAPTGKFNLEQTAVPSHMFGVVPTSNSAFVSVPGNDFNSNKAILSETSSGLLQPGISPAVGSSSESRTFGNVGFGGKSSWQGFLPYQQQGTVPFPPDLNVGFLAPGSPTSSVPIGSPRQPDLALQL